jgi:hypothetical protein
VPSRFTENAWWSVASGESERVRHPRAWGALPDRTRWFVAPPSGAAGMPSGRLLIESTCGTAAASTTTAIQLRHSADASMSGLVGVGDEQGITHLLGERFSDFVEIYLQDPDRVLLHS